MKKVFLDISDDVLRQTFVDLLKVFGFYVVQSQPFDFVIKEQKNSFVLNENLVFEKPVDVFSLVEKLQKNPAISFCGLELDVVKKNVRFCGKSSSLTDTEVKILIHIIENGGVIFAEDLANLVFGKVSESFLKSLATHIYNLRKKLEKITGKQKNIMLENARYSLVLR